MSKWIRLEETKGFEGLDFLLSRRGTDSLSKVEMVAFGVDQAWIQGF